MLRVSEKLPILFVGTRSGTWLKTMGDLWAPLAMCIAAQNNYMVVKTKCPNIFIHTMCFSYQCLVYHVHKVSLFLSHSFWLTLYIFQDPGFPRSRVMYRFQDPGFPRSHVKYTFQDPGLLGTHVRYTFQDPGFPRSHNKYNFQDPESSRSHNLESP